MLSGRFYTTRVGRDGRLTGEESEKMMEIRERVGSEFHSSFRLFLDCRLHFEMGVSCGRHCEKQEVILSILIDQET